MHPSLKSTNVFTDGSPTDACVDFDAHVFAEGGDDIFGLFGKFTIRGKNEGLAFAEIWVDCDEGADGKGPGFFPVVMMLRKGDVKS